MKKTILSVLLCGVMILGITGCGSVTTSKYINKKTKLDISNCNIITDNDKHSGFLGDGDYFVKADCSNDFKYIIKQINLWNELPLSDNLQLIMYGGEKDDITYKYKLAEKAGIPQIKNGNYLFIDRHSESKDKYSDIDLFNRYSYNFTIALFDKDSNILYYYEYDT